MYRGLLSLTQAYASVLSRCFWMFMGVTHASAAVGAWRSCLQGGATDEGLAGCLALTASMVLFVLKLAGVRFLRFRPGRRTWVAICLAIALIHIDCLNLQLDDGAAAKCTAIVVVTTIGGIALSRKVVRIAGNCAAVSPARPPACDRIGQIVWLDAFGPHAWVLALRLYCLRAPPFLGS